MRIDYWIDDDGVAHEVSRYTNNAVKIVRINNVGGESQ